MNNAVIKAEQNNALIVSTMDRKAIETLLPAEQKIIVAALQPKINIIPAMEVVETLLSVITATYTRAGFKIPDDKTLATYADEFYSELMQRFPLVTLSEVREALKAGVYGDAGEFTGLNPKTFIQFMKHYLFTDERKGAVRQFEDRRLYLSAQVELTPEQKEEFNKNWVNEQFQLFLQGKLIIDFIPVDLYEYLYNNGHMPLTREEKKQINTRAWEYFARLKASKRMRGNTRSIADALSNYMNEGPADQIVVNYSKRIAVSDFFLVNAKEGKKQIFEKCCVNSCDGFKCKSGNIHFT